MTDFKGGGVPIPDYDRDDINYISQKTEFTDDVFVYGKLYADLGGDVQTFSTAGIERVRITKEGDVAIGTKNPNVTVDDSNTSILAVGIVTAREYYGVFKGSIAPTVANDKISEGNSSAEVIDSGSDGRFKVTTEGVDRLFVYANGQVLIPSANTNGNFIRDTEDTYQWNGTDINANIPNSSIGLQIRNNDQTTHKTAALAEFRTYRNSSTANPGVVYIGAVDPGDGNAHRSDFIVALKSGNTTVNERLRIKYDGQVDISGDVSISGNLTVTAQPCVQLHTVSNIGTFGSGINNTPVRFSGVHINQGGMTLSNGNSRVQVPVSGIYLVTAMASGGNYPTADAGDGVRFKLMRNGNDYPDVNAYPFNTLGSTNDQEFFWSFSILGDLTASDYLELQFENISTNFGGSIIRGQFGVHLVS